MIIYLKSVMDLSNDDTLVFYNINNEMLELKIVK